MPLNATTTTIDDDKESEIAFHIFCRSAADEACAIERDQRHLNVRRRIVRWLKEYGIDGLTRTIDRQTYGDAAATFANYHLCVKYFAMLTLAMSNPNEDVLIDTEVSPQH
jgi:hypothetical protein